jgi:hypothetical protein
MFFKHLITLALFTAPMAALGAMECKTPKGKKCVCATNKPKKCAHTAKAICLSGEVIEPAPGQLNTSHENYVDLFKQCKEKGGVKEIVFNKPLIDSLHTDTPRQATASAEGE